MMNRIGSVLMVWVAIVPSVVSRADDARQVFQDQFAHDLIKVRATREAEDDIELAKRMIEQAKAADTSAELAGLLCDSAHTLARRDAAGYPTAVAAMDVLAAKDPPRADAARRKVISLYQTEFGKARGEDKAKAADTLIDVLVRYADAAIDEADFTQARVHFAQAQRTARIVKSPREPDLEARLDDLSNRERVSKEIAKWKAKLEESPSDAEAHQALLKLHLIDLDDPTGAIPYLELGGTADDKRYIPLASLAPRDVDWRTCPGVANWYRKVGDTYKGADRLRMLTRAQLYYDRFLAQSKRDDDGLAAALVAAGQTDQELTRLQNEVLRGKPWHDLLKDADPKQDNPPGPTSWKRKDAEIVAEPNTVGDMRLPYSIQGDYLLRIEFTRETGTGGIGVHLPAGRYSVRAHGGNISSVNGRNVNAVAPMEIQTGKRHVIEARVSVDEDEARVSVNFDGAPCVRWIGEPSALSAGGGRGLMENDNPGLFSGGVTVRFQAVEVRMLSGYLKMIR